MNIEILHPELSYKVTGLCFQIHHELGRFCREIQYSDRLHELLLESGLDFDREFNLRKARENSPKGNRVDFLIEGKIIVDIKAKKFITKEDYVQMQRYLKSANIKLGMIINFRSTYLKPKRIINIDYDKDNS